MTLDSLLPLPVICLWNIITTGRILAAYKFSVSWQIEKNRMELQNYEFKYKSLRKIETKNKRGKEGGQLGKAGNWVGSWEYHRYGIEDKLLPPIPAFGRRRSWVVFPRCFFNFFL